MVSRCWSLVLTLVCISLLSCAAQKLLAPEELQKMTNDQYRDYFLNRIDNAVVVNALDSGGYVVVKIENPYGGAARGGSYPRGVDIDTPKYKQSKDEYLILKTELLRRGAGNEPYVFATMEKANKLFEVQLESMWRKSQINSGASGNFRRLYETARDRSKTKGNLLDRLFDDSTYRDIY
ncbi:MAG: hypothetical protein HZA77_11805 [Candidatus Schekmanbacteria bacterium]|nr:hypothetical protein [Candidatus Schekmanbacteria bacterium]